MSRLLDINRNNHGSGRLPSTADLNEPNSIEIKIDKLKELFEKDIITEKEYNDQRIELLKNI